MRAGQHQPDIHLGTYPLGDGTNAAQVGVLDNASWHSYGTTTVTIGASRNDPVAGTTTVPADTAGSVTPPGRLFVRVVATQN